MLYQQGDVLIQSVETVQGKKLTHLILAQGEATGHDHRITKGDAELYETDSGDLFLRVTSPVAELTHQEHKPITLPRGDYRVRLVREYDHFTEEAHQVQD